MPGEVIDGNFVTLLDLPVDRVLERARDADLERVVVIGWKADGDEYFASSFADGGDVVWLLERAKLKLLRMADDE